MKSSAEFALRCRAALYQAYPDLTKLDGDKLLGVIAGSYLAFEAMMEQAKKHERANRVNGIPPTIAEITTYLAEIGYALDPQYFSDFYEARGWKVGRGLAMKDWKSTLRNWKRNNWGPSHTTQTTHSVMPKVSASLGALQMQLDRVRQEMRNILNPGGSAWNKTASQLSQIEIDRLHELETQRARLIAAIESYGT